MAERKACNVLHGREDRSFELKLSLSVTKDLAADGSAEEVFFLITTSFKCIARYWPHWEQRKDDRGWIKISVEVAGGAYNPYKTVASGHIGLPARNGLMSPGMSVAGGLLGGVVTLVARRGEVEAVCAVDGHFTALCAIAVSFFYKKDSIVGVGPARNPRPLLPATASRLDHDILMASELADVTFQVEGEAFKAHRLVLAARSPVFKAELFGQMAESTATVIKIEDMSAPTFGYMLHYMYHGVLPAAIIDTDTTSASSWLLEVERLCVAADRYALDTLQQMCEEILCSSISASTVLSYWVFAEERSCTRLNSRCLDFLAAGENFKEVALTDEYVDLIQKYPSFRLQVRNHFKREVD